MATGAVTERSIDERISEAEADLARAQVTLEALRRERSQEKDASSSTQDELPFNGATFVNASNGSNNAQAASAVSCQEAPYIPAKDHVAAGLLAILLGSFGIHKFYLGYSTAGFVMLAVTVVGGVFTFGIAALVMAIIGIVEGILYLAVSQSTFEETHVLKVREWF